MNVVWFTVGVVIGIYAESVQNESYTPIRTLYKTTENRENIDSYVTDKNSNSNGAYYITRNLAPTRVPEDETTTTEIEQPLNENTINPIEPTIQNSKNTHTTRISENKGNFGDENEISSLKVAEGGISSASKEDTSSKSTAYTTESSSTDNPDQCSEIPEVQFTSLSPSGFSVNVSWEEPDNGSCAYTYTIILDNITYDNISCCIYESEEVLDGCTTYEIGIAASKDENNGMFNNVTFNTIIPKEFNTQTVEEFEATSIPGSDKFNVTWKPPPKNVSQCVTHYYLNWRDVARTQNANDEVTVDANVTYYEIDLVGCRNYTIQITPKANMTHDGQLRTIRFSAEPRVTGPPTNVTSKSGKTDFNITLRTDSQEENRCPLQEIILSCVLSPGKNQNFSWIHPEDQEIKTISEVAPDSRYHFSLKNLSPFTNYTCEAVVTNSAGNSTPLVLSDVITDPDIPSAPNSINLTDVGASNFTIEWTEPEKIPGILGAYQLSINVVRPPSTEIELKLSECDNNITDHYNYSVSGTSYVFDKALAYHEYTVDLKASVEDAGESRSVTTKGITQSSEPDFVNNAKTEPPIYSENDKYHAVLTVKFDPPCNMNGKFKHYKITYRGQRDGYEDITNFTTISNRTITSTKLDLKPQRNYSIDITVETQNFTSLSVPLPSLQSKSGVPPLSSNVTMTAPNADTTTATFKLLKNAFEDENGDIIAYALILLNKSENALNEYGFWNGTNEDWPSLPSNAVQLTPDMWNPFGKEDSFMYTIGNQSNPLNDSTEYWLIVRALTNDAYRDTKPLYFKTSMLEGIDLGLILGLTFGILALLILIAFIIILWRRKRLTSAVIEEKRVSNSSPVSVPVQKFNHYYADIKENYNNIKQQFADLGIQSKEIAGETSFATLPENRRKNRYTNILPFDETRVTLKIDEDDEISSDYINASYIKGYSGKVEYIATQGPLEPTSRDFWKMILQENVSIIVMVSQFVEQSKEKCYHYFPNNHETVSFGESLDVKCCTELHFGTYCIRTLQVRKGTEQRDVIHMQFLEWPDFGVPQGTDNMLQFCTQMREKVNKEGGLIVVHCSAGVGRTGTLIALDILLQTIDNHRDINIYKTVFDLRKQRINMVQTEKQYMFIHTCVKDYIEAPPIQSNENGQEGIYENMEVLRSSLKKNLIQDEVESAL